MTEPQCQCPADSKLTVHAWPCPLSPYEQSRLAAGHLSSVIWRANDPGRFDHDSDPDMLPESGAVELVRGPLSLETMTRFTPHSATETWNLTSTCSVIAEIAARHARADELRRVVDILSDFPGTEDLCTDLTQRADELVPLTKEN